MDGWMDSVLTCNLQNLYVQYALPSASISDDEKCSVWVKVDMSQSHCRSWLSLALTTRSRLVRQNKSCSHSSSGD